VGKDVVSRRNSMCTGTEAEKSEAENILVQ
jgi:hypothetical protein